MRDSDINYLSNYICIRSLQNHSDINECASDPCDNGGTCYDLVNGYQCQCVDGYNGEQCKTGEFSKCTILSQSIYNSMYALFNVVYTNQVSLFITLKEMLIKY